MRQSEWETGATSQQAQGGITRRDALRRGTMAGLGLVWVTPKVASFSMTAQYAQATSPVPETTVPENEGTDPATKDTTEATDPSTASTDPIDPEVEGTVIETTPTTGPEAGATQVEAQPEVKDEVLSSELPFTGLPLEQLLPLAGGAIATGAAAVRMARERKDPEAGSAE